jgi:hypothetical protein
MIYSSHTCVGVEAEKDGNGKEIGTPVHDGMCLFTNLCILKGRFTYVMHPRVNHKCVPRLQTAGRLWNDTGQPQKTVFPLDVVFVADPHGASSPPRTDCGTSAIPARELEAEEGRVLERDVTSAARDWRLHAYVHRFHQYNFGHVLGDDAWPIFQAMAHFEVAKRDLLQCQKRPALLEFSLRGHDVRGYMCP